LYTFSSLQRATEVFSARPGPKMRFGCLALKLVHYSGSRHMRFQWDRRKTIDNVKNMISGLESWNEITLPKVI